MRQVLVSGTHWARYDDDAHSLVEGHKWWLSVNGRNLYATAKIDGRKVFMHRLIMGAASGTVLDHIDGDGLNNQRANLRFCTRSQNLQNSRWRNTPGRTARYKGVWRVTKRCRRCWRAGICANRKYRSIGSYWTEEEAARSYDAQARLLHGEFARLNFPDGETRV